jgi:alpha-L-fucosidase
MHVKQKIPVIIGSTLLCLLSSLKAETNGMTEFLKSKYGFFVHYVWGGSQDKPFTCDRHGRRPATFDDLAAAFDAPGFASDLEKWGVEYVILTAWHYNINPLFPSETMKKWGLENHTCKRDVLRDVITACKAKGIKVMLYTHPRDGHDLSLEDQLKTGWGGPNGSDPKWENFDRKKWNDFTNELYQELIARYGNDIIGIFSDEGSPAGDSYRVIDYPRLRRTVKALQPDLMMEQNFYGTTYSLDVG